MQSPVSATASIAKEQKLNRPLGASSADGLCARDNSGSTIKAALFENAPRGTVAELVE